MTVLDVFLDAALDFGFPSRLRGDRGGENIACAIYMVMLNGPNRASFMWGSYVDPHIHLIITNIV